MEYICPNVSVEAFWYLPSAEEYGQVHLLLVQTPFRTVGRTLLPHAGINEKEKKEKKKGKEKKTLGRGRTKHIPR